MDDELTLAADDRANCAIGSGFTPRIAVLVPCYNEYLTIAKVLDDFSHELPAAQLYVYDNNSTDGTARIAREHGACVKRESRQGKGNVVRQMFRDIEADIYILVDGDDTAMAADVHTLIQPIIDGNADMVIGDRLSRNDYQRQNKRPLHTFGNRLICSLINFLYRATITDALSGFRAFGRPFVKTFPILSTGFEIEVEMDIHAIDKNWRVVEIPVAYQDRPEGSVSKLSTVRDGFRIVGCIMSLFKDYKPLVLFATIGILLVVIGLACGITVIMDFLATGLVERFPTALLAVALVISGMLSLVCGLILDTTVKGYRKQYELEILRESSRRITE